MIAALLSLALFAAPPAETKPLRRFALSIGANDGGASRPQLRYAVADATAFNRVLSELGGVAITDSRLVENPSLDGLRSALEQLRGELAQLPPGAQRVEVMLYYSGHSDEEGLLLQGAHLPYSEIRAWLASVPAAVRIAILDSCASGTLTRGKGGTRVAPFLVDASTQVQGHAILTSSSETEASQESDRIGGSFFTHALVSAMRGAADATHDGRITLNEAYQFTFDETLARTEKTRGGAQHPAYDIQLVGTGDLVMTDLHASSSTLVLPETLVGRFFVRDEGGRLVAELRKFAGRLVELGLEPGTYAVTRELDGAVAEGRFTVSAGGRVPIDGASFNAVKREATASRGGDSEPSEYVWVPVDVSFFPQLSVNGDRRVVNNLSLSLIAGRSTRLHGLAFSIGGHRADELVRGGQFSVGLNSSGGPTSGLQLTVGANLSAQQLVGLQSSVGFNSAAAVTGLQLSVGTNIASGDVSGLQGAVGANVGRDVTGLQLGVGANVAWRGLHGIQLSAGANVARTGDDLVPSRGIQGTAGVNVIAGAFSGAQLAAGANWSTGSMTGAQLSSGFNYASALSGAQLSVINIGGDVRGLQLGVINIGGEVRGTQLGVVNIASRVDGESVGVLSLIGDGLHQPEVWVDDTALINAGVKLGGTHLYSVLTAGVVDSKRWTYGLGVGGHITTDSPFSVDVDVVAHDVRQFTDGQLNVFWASLRGVVSYRIFSHLSVFAGPTLNLSFSWDAANRPVARIPQWALNLGDRPGSLWVGGLVGASF